MMPQKVSLYIFFNHKDIKSKKKNFIVQKQKQSLI